MSALEGHASTIMLVTDLEALHPYMRIGAIPQRAARGTGAAGRAARPILAATQARARAETTAEGPVRPRKPGPTPYAPSDKDRATVRVMVAGGIEQRHIAIVLKLSVRSLRRHFHREIDAGAAEANAMVVAALFRMATRAGGNFHAAKWWTQARMGWSERITVVDVSAEPDVTKLSDAEIEVRLAKLARRSPAALRAVKAGGAIQ